MRQLRKILFRVYAVGTLAAIPVTSFAVENIRARDGINAAMGAYGVGTAAPAQFLSDLHQAAGSLTPFVLDHNPALNAKLAGLTQTHPVVERALVGVLSNHQAYHALQSHILTASPSLLQQAIWRFDRYHQSRRLLIRSAMSRWAQLSSESLAAEQRALNDWFEDATPAKTRAEEHALIPVFHQQLDWLRGGKELTPHRLARQLPYRVQALAATHVEVLVAQVLVGLVASHQHYSLAWPYFRNSAGANLAHPTVVNSRRLSTLAQLRRMVSLDLDEATRSSFKQLHLDVLQNEFAVPIDQVPDILAALYAARTRPVVESAGWAGSAWESEWRKLREEVVVLYDKILATTALVSRLRAQRQALSDKRYPSLDDIDILDEAGPPDAVGRLRSELAALLVREALADKMVAYQRLLWRDGGTHPAGEIDVVLPDAYVAIVSGPIKTQAKKQRLRTLMTLAGEDRKKVVVYHDSTRPLEGQFWLTNMAKETKVTLELRSIPWK